MLQRYRNADSWHSRGYLPHFDRPGSLQFITYRLADSIPRELILQLRERLRHRPRAEYRSHIEALLDRGFGACVLRQPPLAAIVEDSFLHFDGKRYWLLAWCIMPNHVHVLIQLREDWLLPKVIQSWKRFSARSINLELGRSGQFWEPEYFDRVMRDEDHIRNTIEYIEDNPVKAGISSSPGSYRFSSAGRRSQRIFVAE